MKYLLSRSCEIYTGGENCTVWNMCDKSSGYEGMKVASENTIYHRGTHHFIGWWAYNEKSIIFDKVYERPGFMGMSQY